MTKILCQCMMLPAHQIPPRIIKCQRLLYALHSDLPNRKRDSMETLLTLIHVLIAVVLIGLVLIQDSKGGALGIGGGTSNSVLGAGGAQTLAAKATRWVAAIFAVTCISLSIWTAKKTQSVVSGVLPANTPANTVVPKDATPATPIEATPSSTAPANPIAPIAPEKK